MLRIVDYEQLECYADELELEKALQKIAVSAIFITCMSNTYQAVSRSDNYHFSAMCIARPASSHIANATVPTGLPL